MTPCQFDMGRMQPYPGQMYPPLLSEPSATEPYYTMSVWHVEEYRCTLVRCTPHLIKPSSTEPYCTMSVWHVDKCIHIQVRHTAQSNPVLQSPTTPCQFDMWKNADVPSSNVPPTNQTQFYRTLLHHVSLACGQMYTYPGQTYPPIKPSATELYYAMSIWHVDECIHIQVRCTSSMEPSATEPYYTMSVWHWMNAYVSRSDIPPGSGIWFAIVISL